MEKNIHNDPMDDFVKKSFEEYAENPSDNMWDRIEVDLLPAENHKPLWYAWRNYRWQLAAAAVILLLVSRLVCVQNYYEAKLRSISGEKEQAAQQATPMPALDPKTVATAKDPANTTSQSPQEIPASTATTAKQPAPASSQINPKTNKSTASTERLEKPEIALSNQSTGTQIAQATTAVAAIPPNETLAVTPTVSLDGQPSLLKPADLSLLDQRAVPLSFTQNNQPSLIAVPTKRHQEATGWYAGLSISPHLIVEKSHRPSRPGPMNPRQLYANKQNRSQVSADVCLRIGKKINGQFALESGLGFQQMTRTATHRPRFEYREGHLQNSGGAESRNFDYDLNTYGGSASVSLRTEVSGSDTPAESERIGALITSREQIQMLQIPLLGVARLGHGRTKMVVKAGILGSYLLKNELSISAFTLDNMKLRMRGSNGYAVQYNRPQHIIFGYQVSAGVEYWMNKHLSIAAAPIVSGDFTRKDPQQGKLPGRTTVGLNVGANWWF